ncbi:MAG: hypothetical protein ACK4ZU_07545 [Allorhizobium sp.]|jgi:hypothetical protein
MPFVVTAAVALLLIELYLRRRPWAIALTGVIAVVGTIIWIFSDHQSRSQRSAVASVTVTVETDGTTCTDPALPLPATLTNSSSDTVNRIAFDLIGRQAERPGIAYRGILRHDQVLRPGESMTRCFPLLYHGFTHPRPQIIDATKYEWTAQVTLVGFGNAPAE